METLNTSESQNVMDTCLKLINSSCSKISSAQFGLAGIFTNAMITRPELTSLIRDALPSEQHLYRITKATEVPGVTVRTDLTKNRRQSGAFMDDRFTELQPERVDGKSAYRINCGNKRMKTAIAAPQILKQTPTLSDAMSLPTKRKIASQYTLIPREAIESGNPREMCDAILAVEENTPQINGIFHSKQKALQLKNEYERLSIELQKLAPLEPDDQAINDEIYNLLTQDINGAIAKEQAEVDRLEQKLDLI